LPITAIPPALSTSTATKRPAGYFRIVLPDGSVKHLHSIAHPVLDESGEIIEVVGTTVDVTERKAGGRDSARERSLFGGSTAA